MKAEVPPGLVELAVVMTCSYPESGLTGLIPAGVVVWADNYSGYKIESRRKAGDALRARAAAEGFSHVFNVRFEEWQRGHPSYDDNWTCVARGDAYVKNPNPPRG